MSGYEQLYDGNYLKSIPPNSRLSESNYNAYQPYENAQLQRLEEKDASMKHRIRVLRVISRVLGVFLSIFVVTPLAVTIAKYLETRNTRYNVNGEQISPWPEHTITVYTYVYFGVSAMSLLLNLVILVSYCCGVRRANNAATLSTVWSSIVIISHIAIWIAAVAIYRYGKHKVDDKWRDLWGWSCSEKANDLQPFIKDIQYTKYCSMQNIGYYAGIVHVGANILTGIIFIFMAMRNRTKKQLEEYKLDDAKEPLRRP